MLIYAATVEMIAGDFVFGDVDGGHHHHHHEPHADGGFAEAEMQRQDVGDDHDPRLVPSSPLANESGDVHLTMPRTTKQASVAKRVLAIVSLLMGVVMMILVGIGE